MSHYVTIDVGVTSQLLADGVPSSNSDHLQLHHDSWRASTPGVSSNGAIPGFDSRVQPPLSGNGKYTFGQGPLVLLGQGTCVIWDQEVEQMGHLGALIFEVLWGTSPCIALAVALQCIYI